jgi:Ni/Co efflux regulator RcnB
MGMLRMNQKTIAMAAVLMAAVLAGLFTTSPLAYAEDRDNDKDRDHDRDHDKDKGGDESKTSTDQSVKQKNTGSGDSANFNCGENLIKAGVDDQDCEWED